MLHATRRSDSTDSSEQKPSLRRAERWQIVKYLSLPLSGMVAVERLVNHDAEGALSSIALGMAVTSYAYTEENIARNNFMAEIATRLNVENNGVED